MMTVNATLAVGSGKFLDNSGIHVFRTLGQVHSSDEAANQSEIVFIVACKYLTMQMESIRSDRGAQGTWHETEFCSIPPMPGTQSPVKSEQRSSRRVS